MPRVRKTRRSDCTGPRTAWAAAPPFRSPTLPSSNGPEVEHVSCQEDGWELLPCPSTTATLSPPSPGGHLRGPAFRSRGVCDRPSREATSPLGDHWPSASPCARHRCAALTPGPGRRSGGNRRAASHPSEEFGSSATTRIPRPPSSFLVPGMLSRRLGELNSGSEESARRSCFHLRRRSGAAEESAPAAAHAPSPRGCGHVPQPRASIMHGRTCSRDPRATSPPSRRRRVPSGQGLRSGCLGRRNRGGAGGAGCASVSSGCDVL